MSKSESMIFIGMDVHQDSVTLAVFEGASKEAAVVQKLPNDLRKLRRFFERWAERGLVRTCYEASGARYVLYRELTEWGYSCEIIAPSMTPIRPGEQRKHDRRDAIMLARLYRAGELVPIRIPSPNDERVRDLVRCRETFQRELLRSRHYILKFLSRRGFVFRGGGRWGPKHRAWLERLLHEERLASQDRAVFSEYLALMDYKIGRRDDLDRQIEEVAFSDAYRSQVQRLACFRGISTLSAMTLISEIGDWRRFERPGQLMAYLGLVPREHSSGERQMRGRVARCTRTARPESRPATGGGPLRCTRSPASWGTPPWTWSPTATGTSTTEQKTAGPRRSRSGSRHTRSSCATGWKRWCERICEAPNRG